MTTDNQKPTDKPEGVTTLAPSPCSAKYTLLYSEEATALRSPNRAKTNDGVEVEYTCMVEEAVHGRWQDNYLWSDAKVVGYMDSYDQITHVSHDATLRWYWPNDPKLSHADERDVDGTGGIR